jgi:hypothetical protein
MSLPIVVSINGEFFPSNRGPQLSLESSLGIFSFIFKKSLMNNYFLINHLNTANITIAEKVIPTMSPEKPQRMMTLP